MCGIFAYLINENDNTIELHNNTYKNIEENFMIGKQRGPEYSKLHPYNIDSNHKLLLGFHRLAINGLDEISHQPFHINNTVLVCNGEIYNYKELAEKYEITLQTNSDCEIILHLYKILGISCTLNLIHGVFSFILYDKQNNNMYVARDPYGVRPLYFYFNRNVMIFSSELKSMYKLTTNTRNIRQFNPNQYMCVELNNYTTDKEIGFNYNKYTYSIKYSKDVFKFETHELYSNLFNCFYEAVKIRVLGTTERPIACLLSGGLDSSLVAAIVSRLYKGELKTFSIGLEGSEDLKYAAIVAKHIGSQHNEIIVSEDEFFNAIPEVIKTIESYDTTTVRASVGNYLVSKYIKENTDCKVIFNGDGADEVMGGYLYLKKALNSYQFDKECIRLIEHIHMFDVLRSDKCISSNGLEPRTPFLDKNFVKTYFSIFKDIRYFTTIYHCEKYLMRKSVEIMDNTLLPKEVLWRKKEAFSDGVSSLNRSWYQIITEKVDNMLLSNSDLYVKMLNASNYYKTVKFNYKSYHENDSPHNYPDTNEKLYYRYLYESYYPNTAHLIPYFWMPKYIKTNDPSARTLNNYND